MRLPGGCIAVVSVVWVFDVFVVELQFRLRLLAFQALAAPTSNNKSRRRRCHRYRGHLRRETGSSRILHIESSTLQTVHGINIATRQAAPNQEHVQKATAQHNHTPLPPETQCWVVAIFIPSARGGPPRERHTAGATLNLGGRARSGCSGGEVSGCGCCNICSMHRLES